MPQSCKICKHPERQAIDAVLGDGWPSLRVIGARYGVSKDSLSRHYRAHMPAEPRQIVEIAVEQKNEDLEPERAVNCCHRKRGAEDSEGVEDLQANSNHGNSKFGPSGKDSEGVKDQPRQIAEDSPVKNSEELQDAEARYRAFIERWRGRVFVSADEMADWPEEPEALNEALKIACARGDLLVFDRYYLATAQAARRHNAEKC